MQLHGLWGWLPLKLADQSWVWLFSRRSKSCGRGLSPSAYKLYTPTLSVRLWHNSSAAAAVAACGV